MGQKNARARRGSPIPFAVCVCAFAVLTAVLVWNQVAAGAQYERFVSDMPFHLNFVRNGADVQYSLFHLLLSLLLSLTGPQGLAWAMIVILALCNGASMLLLRIFISEPCVQGSEIAGTRYAADFLTVCLFFVSMLVLRLPGYYLYLAAWSGNPWHNPTYWFCRPFAILAFLSMVRFKRESDGGAVRAGTLVLLGVSNLAAAFAKPSFFLVFIPACFVYFLVDLIAKRFRPLGRYLLLALSLLPSAFALLWQNSILFVADAPSKLVLAPGAVWSMYSPCLPVSILLGVAFPLYVTVRLLVQRRFAQAGFPLHIALLSYAFAFAELYLLAESGARFEDANFAWGYCFALFFLFAVCAREFFFRDNTRGAGKCIGAALFAAHLGCGVWYFCHVFGGAAFH